MMQFTTTSSSTNFIQSSQKKWSSVPPLTRLITHCVSLSELKKKAFPFYYLSLWLSALSGRTHDFLTQTEHQHSSREVDRRGSIRPADKFASSTTDLLTCNGFAVRMCSVLESDCVRVSECIAHHRNNSL